MQQIEHTFRLLQNDRLNPKTLVMTLAAPQGIQKNLFKAPGQFVNLKVEGRFLRRPLSVCDWTGDTLTLLYDVVGEGTLAMSRWLPGREVNLLAPLGNGFNLSPAGQNPLLIGGGIGIAPLYWLGRLLIEEGKSPTIVLGFNAKAEISWEKEFRNLTPDIVVSTACGDYGVKGFVTDTEPLKNARNHSYYFACGPMPMLRALGTSLNIPGQLSLDERMACGFGACMCCSLQTRNGHKRICKDGPVFTSDELIWK